MKGDGARQPTAGFKSLQAFLAKFNNDWVMSFASGLAFNLIVALIPITIAMIALAGFVYGLQAPTIQAELIIFIQHPFPPPIPSEEVVGLALDSLNKNAGLLGIAASVAAVIGGAGLFVGMEGYFDIIYHTHTRGLIRQYIMAIGMILLFVLLTPFIIVADALPALAQSFLQGTSLGQLPGFGSISGPGGILAGSLISWVLIETIYVVVPNRRIRFRKSWFGAIGFAVIFLFFFYYFALILLGGAEINAFFGEGIAATTDNLSGIVRDHSNRPAATAKEKL